MNAMPPCNDFIFRSLTDQQIKVLELVGEGLTGKEIGARLDISEGAAAQRILKLRQKFGGITKSELARLYREFRADDIQSGTTEKLVTKIHLHTDPVAGNDLHRSQSSQTLVFNDSATFDATPPWPLKGEARLVPEVLDGEHAISARWAYAVAAAVGMAILLLVLMAVANALSDLI